MEIRVRVLKVRQDLSEAIELRGDIHKAITFLLYNLHDLIGEDFKILSQAPSRRLDLLQVHVLQIFLVAWLLLFAEIRHTELLE